MKHFNPKGKKNPITYQEAQEGLKEVQKELEKYNFVLCHDISMQSTKGGIEITLIPYKYISLGRHTIADISIPEKPERVASWHFDQLQGCCGVIVSSGAVIYPSYAGKGWGTKFMAIKLKLAKYLGYTVLICTDTLHNTPQRKILKRYGFEDAFTFINRRTGNNVALSVIGVYEE